MACILDHNGNMSFGTHLFLPTYLVVKHQYSQNPSTAYDTVAVEEAKSCRAAGRSGLKKNCRTKHKSRRQSENMSRHGNTNSTLQQIEHARSRAHTHTITSDAASQVKARTIISLRHLWAHMGQKPKHAF
eukprot:1613168-Amphidinium_carterae.1